MKPIVISPGARLLNELFQHARSHNLILQAPDGVQFLLARIPDIDDQNNKQDIQIEGQGFEVGPQEDFDEEIAASRQNPDLMRFLDERAAQARPGQDTTLEHIRQRLNSTSHE